MTKTLNVKAFLPLLCALPLLAACSGAKEQLGLTKKSPDEFAVIKHAPLAMPPDYGLRPPTPGAARPQEQGTTDQARQAVFGNSATQASETPTSGEESLLQQAGGSVADPNIRQRVDSETSAVEEHNRPVAKRLLGVMVGDDEPPASVVDAKAEAERLRKNTEEGKPVTEGETPSVDD